MYAVVALSICVAADASVVALRKGDIAPFDGQLLDLQTAARLVAAGDFARQQAGVQVREAQEQTAVDAQRADALGLMLKQRATDLGTCDTALGQCRVLVDQRRSAFGLACLWGGLGLFAGATLGALAMGALQAN